MALTQPRDTLHTQNTVHILCPCIYMLCETIYSICQSFLTTKILFLKILFFQNFVSFYLILFYLIKKNRKNFVMNIVHEQCPISDSKTILSQKTESGAQSTQLGPTSAHRRAQERARGHVVAPPAFRVVPCRRPQPAVSWAQGAVSQRAMPLACLPCPGLAVCFATQPSLIPLPPVTIHLGVLRYNAQPNQPPNHNIISVLRHSA